jgi:hypothetical protein
MDRRDNSKAESRRGQDAAVKRTHESGVVVQSNGAEGAISTKSQNNLYRKCQAAPPKSRLSRVYAALRRDFGVPTAILAVVFQTVRLEARGTIQAGSLTYARRSRGGAPT